MCTGNPTFHHRAPLQRGCSSAWPTDHGMFSAECPCSTSRLCPSGLSGFRSYATVSKGIMRCTGWQNGCVHSIWFSLPDSRVASLGLGKVQYYSSGNGKDGSPKSAPGDASRTEKRSGAAKVSSASTGGLSQGLTKAETIQVKVRAVLKKREYGAKYTQNNFITAVRAMNEFCLKPRALDVWGSPEALARERNLRKEVEREYEESRFLGFHPLNIFIYGQIKGQMILFYPAYCILAGSLVSEGATLLVAINEIKKSAHQQRVSFYEYVMQSRDPSTNVVLLEDAAAVLGVIMAAGCMGLTSLTGNPYYDSLGSLGVGTLLGTVSAFLIYTNTEALLGRSIQAERVQKLTEILENDPAVRAIHDVKATDMGLSKVRFKAEVDFDGRVVTRSYLEKQDIDQILSDIQQVKTPEELENFMLKHGENIIDTLGAEVDRLEKELKQRNPEVRHVDLEIL
uniref:Solute carrier family 30 member 9 n=1 Tax=Nothobranchius furzeri TaxID=105023 RepID=A0A8C6KBR0_NOTFU